MMNTTTDNGFRPASEVLTSLGRDQEIVIRHNGSYFRRLFYYPTVDGTLEAYKEADYPNRDNPLYRESFPIDQIKVKKFRREHVGL